MRGPTVSGLETVSFWLPAVPPRMPWIRDKMKGHEEEGATRFRRKLSRPEGMPGANRPQLDGN